MKTFLFYLLLLISGTVSSKVLVYFNYGLFSTPNNKPYLETYLTISGNSVKYLPVGKGYQASVTIAYVIKKGEDIVKASKYNLLSPMAADSLQKPGFIDSQRFQLENGTYTLEMEIFDTNTPEKKSTFKNQIVIDFVRDKKVTSSSIQILESYNKALKASAISKNGYDMVPYNLNYYSDGQNSLKFYFESYNLDSVLGKNNKFVYNYYIQESSSLKKQQGMSGFQKQSAMPVNALLAQFDISTLPSGNYELVIEVKDATGMLQLEKKWYFQRKNTAVQVITTARKHTVEDYFNSYQSADSLKMFVECLWPISSTTEREWEQTQLVNKDPVKMRNFMVDYWKRESGDTLDPLKMWLDYYKEVQQTLVMMKCGKQKGYYTDRGRVFLQYGKPDQRQQVNSSPNSYPYEIWQYYRMYDRTTGQFHTNKKFVFANFGIADDCYQLIHSDAKGERYDDKWQMRLMSRTQQNNNIDDTKPTNTFGNNMDDFFSSPR